MPPESLRAVITVQGKPKRAAFVCALSLRDLETTAYHVDDAEARERLWLRLQSMCREFPLALQQLLNGLAPRQSS